MAALTEARIETLERENKLLVVPVKGAVQIFAGALVAANAGLAVPGSSAANLVALGRAEETVDNRLGVDAAKTISVRAGTFKFENSSTDAITQADLGKKVFIQDDQTVKKTGGAGFSEAGKFIGFAADGGVWVEVGA